MNSYWFIGLTSCIICPEKTYASEQGAISCTKCETAHHKGSTSCSKSKRVTLIVCGVVFSAFVIVVISIRCYLLRRRRYQQIASPTVCTSFI